MSMQWDTFDYRIAEHYLSALINGDQSGMTEDEIAEFDAWESSARQNARANGWSIGHWCDVPDSGEDWGQCNIGGLFTMRCTVQLHVHRVDPTC